MFVYLWSFQWNLHAHISHTPIKCKVTYSKSSSQRELINKHRNRNQMAATYATVLLITFLFCHSIFFLLFLFLLFLLFVANIWIKYTYFQQTETCICWMIGRDILNLCAFILCEYLNLLFIQRKQNTHKHIGSK